MWSLAGIAASRIVGLVPWAGPRTMLAMLYLCLAVMAIGGPAGAVWIHMHAKINSAVEMRDAEWKLKLSEAEASYDQLVARALQEAAAADIPDNDDDVKRLCKQHPKSCRDSAAIIRK
jgi:hypothetical protein